MFGRKFQKFDSMTQPCRNGSSTANHENESLPVDLQRVKGSDVDWPLPWSITGKYGRSPAWRPAGLLLSNCPRIEFRGSHKW